MNISENIALNKELVLIPPEAMASIPYLSNNDFKTVKCVVVGESDELSHIRYYIIYIVSKFPFLYEYAAPYFENKPYV